MSAELSQADSDARWSRLFDVASGTAIVRAFKVFRQHGIEPILIKGWAAARNYPKPTDRAFTDIDLAVASQDYEAAYKLVAEAGYAGLPIDLHEELRHLDSAAWQDLYENSLLIDLLGEPIRVLRPEDHLRVMCVHFLTDGAWFRERLWDIYYAVENRPVSFDWSRCLESVSAHRQRWVICTIGLAHCYLGLYVDDLPFAHQAKALPSWLLSAVERQWESNERLEPLRNVKNDRRRLVRQLAKRFPPEPIYSTVDMDGDFDSPFRIHYQLGSMLKRAVPSIWSFGRVWRSRRS